MILDGRAARNLAYAAGEILLIFVGILLAVQIRYWNDQRQAAAAATEFLTMVKWQR